MSSSFSANGYAPHTAQGQSGGINATTSIPVHPAAELFPMLEGDHLHALREDIREHGVREPVVMLDGALLDGRNRHRCAQELGIECPQVEYDGDDPVAFVVSHNLHRRHLTESQRAMVAGKLANMQRGTRTDLAPTANLQEVSSSEAAGMLNVSERSVNSARKVQSNPDLADAVERGDLSVSLAAKAVDLPEDDVEDIVTAPPDQMKAVARAHVANNSGNNEWYTPAEFLDAAREVLGGIDLDPASSEIANKTVGAERYFTEADDGLIQEWPACRIWMNPPYAQPLISKFSAKMAEAVDAGAEAIVLVNNATETAWFQDLVGACSAVCFPKGRIRFLDPSGAASGAPLQGQVLIYGGDNPERFAEVFASFGLVLRNG